MPTFVQCAYGQELTQHQKHDGGLLLATNTPLCGQMNFSGMSTGSDKLKNLFEDLGKPTLRGIRKCPKCGTYNGTRGISCKNKSCDAVFKEVAVEKKKPAIADAVKIITGSTAQVYSVRVRDRGPEYRGFVQLSVVASDETVESELVAETTARCFVETCPKLGSPPQTEQPLPCTPCQHIKSALQCFTEARPLTLKNSVLNALPISTEIKQLIWLLATETTGPLVQRVSKNIMVVKCKPNAKHPLGFLHFSFFDFSRKRDTPEHRFHCTCRAFKGKSGVPQEESQKRCVHFYACICAFASDEKLSEEFGFYISLYVSHISAPDRFLVAIFSDPQQQQQCEMDLEVLPESVALIAATTGSSPTSIEEVLSPKRRKKDDSLVQASNALLTLQSKVVNSKGRTGNGKKLISSQPPKKTAKKAILIDETAVSITFHQWLASVTERINQSMHYQFDGQPEPLVFHVPQTFFDCLQQRISSGGRKKRLPNSTTAFVRRDALPLGTFSKYTWHITNILHVKQIFDTHEMPLEVTRSFVENRDGTFDLYDPPKVEIMELEENYRKTQSTPLIKPFELKTFLKVGTMSPDQKDPTPFVIEWIPDILPKSKIGEMRIKFEYGHQRNGQIDYHVPSQQVIHIHQIQAS